MIVKNIQDRFISISNLILGGICVIVKNIKYRFNSISNLILRGGCLLQTFNIGSTV